MLDFFKTQKKQGDILVVALKDDECVHLKGKNRPIMCETDRAIVVHAIDVVDYVLMINYDPSIIPEIEYDNKDQHEWIIMFQEMFKKLHPDVFYHEINPKLEAARTKAFEKYGIKGVAANRLEGVSTSHIIAKINKMN